MQTRAPIVYQFLDACEMAVDDLSLFKPAYYHRANVRAATHRRRVAERLCRFSDRIYQQTLRGRPVSINFGLHACQRRGADQRAGPGAEILRGKVLTHDLLNIVVNVTSFDVDKSVVAVHVFKDIAAGFPQQVSDNSGRRPVAKFAPLPDTGLARKIKHHHVSLDLNVFRTQGGKTDTAILIRINFAARPDKTHRENSEDAGHHALSRIATLAQIFGNAFS